MPTPTASYLLVDGHSMIFAWPDLRALHAHSGAAAREELARRLTAYQDQTGERVVLVFDGRQGPPGEKPARVEDIQILYSRAGGSADGVIERLAGKYAASRRLTVASRDRAVLDCAAGFGAHCLSANALRELLEGAERRFREGIRRRRT